MNRWSQIQHPTRRLTTLYITALSTVALLTVLGQVVIQSALQQQSSDALVINVAGRQRMLSQRLSKAALALAVFPDAQSRQQNTNELQEVVALWQHSQQGLQHGDAALGLPGHNSQAVQQLFASIEPEYKSMLKPPMHCSYWSDRGEQAHERLLLLLCCQRSASSSPLNRAS